MEHTLYSTSFDAATRVLTVTGELDELATDLFRDDLERVTESYTRPLTLDLSAVTFLPSSAAAAVAVAQHRGGRAQARVDVVARQDSLAQRVLALCDIPHRAT